MIHLTLTGYYAGTPICGVNKQQAKSQGDKFVHAIYAPLENSEWIVEVCIDCLEAWNNENN